MGAMACQITSLTIVYSTVYSGTDQRKHQSSVSLAFLRGIHRWLVNFPHKWPVTRKMFPLDDVIMGQSCEKFPCYNVLMLSWHWWYYTHHTSQTLPPQWMNFTCCCYILRYLPWYYFPGCGTCKWANIGTANIHCGCHAGQICWE